MAKRYLGIGVFALLTGAVFVTVFGLLRAWDAAGEQRTAVMVVATFALAAVILLFRLLMAGRDWDPPGDVAFATAAVALIPLMFPEGIRLLLAAILVGVIVVALRLIWIARNNRPKSELAYTVALYVQFVGTLALLSWLGIG